MSNKRKKNGKITPKPDRWLSHHYVECKKSEEKRDFPDSSPWGDRRAVCKRCHVAMNDIEPMSPNGEFWHPARDKGGKPYSCKNAGHVFTIKDLEIEPFLRKAARRRNKRLGLRP